MNMAQRKVVVVTGSNTGIGYAIVKGLCRDFSGDVYLTARDKSKGLAAVKSLNDLGFYPKFHQLDITVEHSIMKLKDHLVKEYGGLDVLVNNAGVGYKDERENPTLAIETIKVNYFATKKTCDVLFPILRPHARVVNVSSRRSLLFNISSEPLRSKLASETLTVNELDELMKSFIKSVEQKDIKDIITNWGDYHCVSYVVSKVGVSALTRIQQREFLNDVRTDIIVNSVHPGYVNTKLTKGYGSNAPLTIEEGAVSSLYAALLPENVAEPRGAFIWENKDIIDWTGPFNEKYSSFST